MEDLRTALHGVADRVADYRTSLSARRVTPTVGRAAVRASLDPVVPAEGASLATVLEELERAAGPGLMASAGPRYFGFVVGGSTDAGLLADMLTTGWDQVAFNDAMSPAGVAFEDVAGGWLKQILGIPATASVGFATGGQAANTVGLTAARWRVLRDAGWDVGRDGLNGAPPVRVVAGAERHATIDRALRLLGLGERSLVEVPSGPNGAVDARAMGDVLADAAGPTIVCAQAGNVNTGACDDLRSIGEATRRAGAWLHVDGAFGLWAAASPRTRHLVDGLDFAHSWACDGHKWLNVPYDSGYAFCADPESHASALAYTASYLTGQVEGREFGGGDFVPESSRRARGFATWATLRSLGRSGVEELVDRTCGHARRLAASLADRDGFEIVNDVVLNQVLVRVGDTELTDEIEREIQEDGTCWLGATTWGGERLLRISISNWSTTEEDVERSVEAIAAARTRVVAGRGSP